MFIGGVVLCYIVFYFIYQQYIVNVFIVVVWFGVNLFVVGDIVGYCVVVELYFVLYGVQIVVEVQLMQYGKDILFFECLLWVIFCFVFVYKYVV